MSKKKTAREKLIVKHQPKVEVLDKPFGGMAAGTKMFIGTPMFVKDYVEAIPKGQTRTLPEMREEMAKANGADGTCPLTSGIFLRLVTEAALEDLADGKTIDQISPFWRMVDKKSPVAKKLGLDPAWLDELRASEAG